MVLKSKILLDKAGEGNGSGGAGSALTSLGGGSGVPPDAGNAGVAPGAGDDKPAGNSNSNNPPAGGAAADWRVSLPEELQTDASIKKFTDVSSLARAYVNAQKLIGADKISIPSKHATEEDWKQVYHKLGLPEKKEEYKVNKKEDSTIDDAFLSKYSEKAYEFGVLPQQAQKLAEWFDEENKASIEAARVQHAARIEAELNDLKKEWGEGFKKKITGAYKVVEKFGGEEFLSFLDNTGLGNNVQLIKFLSSVADNAMAEGTILGSDEPGATGMTPKEAQAEINKVMSNKNHPYFIKDHPGHKAAVEEVMHLFSMVKPDARPALKPRT